MEKNIKLKNAIKTISLLNSKEIELLVDIVDVIFRYKSNPRQKSETAKKWFIENKDKWNDLKVLVNIAYEEGIYSRGTYRDDIYYRFKRWKEDLNG